MENKIIDKMKGIVGETWTVSDYKLIKSYLKDETVPSLVPEKSKNSIVVKPGNAEEISKILNVANEENVPVIARGGGTGLVAGVVPVYDSIIISMERFNEILNLDRENFTVTCEAGVTLGELLEHLNKVNNLFFPIHPGDEGATVGGMVVNNAGGARAVRHGVMRNQVRGVEIVLPTGEIMNFGSKTLKNVAGYDLLHLIIGSEGTLGIVTKVILSVHPEPQNSATLLLSFNDRKKAISAVPEIMQNGVNPLALEYIERDMAEMAAEHLGENWPVDKGNVDLMVVLSETEEDILYKKIMKIEKICQNYSLVDSAIAERVEEQETILTVRSNIDTATDKEDLSDDIDAAIPPAFIDDFLSDLLEIYKEYGAKLSAYGHAADGNLHIYIYKEKGEIPEYYNELKKRFYKTALKYGGTIAAEHGIGKTKINDLDLQLSEKEFELMKKIKKSFDPNNILNPNTIFKM